MTVHTKLRIMLSLSALLFAGVILAVSLFVTHTAAVGFGSNIQELSLGEEVLPGHILYPMIMAFDQVQLWTTSSQDRVLLEVEYAQRRLYYAQRLLALQRPEMALTTLTKAEKYLQQAAQLTMDQETPTPVKAYLVRSLEYHQKTLRQISTGFSDQDRVMLDKLGAENQGFKASLEASL